MSVRSAKSSVTMETINDPMFDIDKEVERKSLVDE